MQTLSTFKAAVIQLRCTEEVQRNLRNAVAGVRRAADRGATLVVLPERFAYPAQGGPLRESADTIPGHLTNLMSDLASELRIVLVAGSVLERVPSRRKFYNTTVVFDEFGRPVAKYRKVHLFQIRNRRTGAISETRTMMPGREAVLVETSCGRVGLSICYDLRFPELYRDLAHRGAQLLAVPSAFQRVTGRAHWMALLRARAIENQCYCLAAAQCGTVSGQAFFGHSAIIDPWGRVLAEAEGRPEVVIATISMERLREVRRELPSLADSIRLKKRGR